MTQHRSGWRETGVRLRQERREKLLRYASECDAEIVSNDGYRISIPNDRYGDVDPEFRGCLWGHFYLAEGKHSPLIPYLLSDRPLGKNERRHLAAILAVSEYRDKRDNGRPLDHDLRIAASMACGFMRHGAVRTKNIASQIMVIEER